MKRSGKDMKILDQDVIKKHKKLRNLKWIKKKYVNLQKKKKWVVLIL